MSRGTWWDEEYCQEQCPQLRYYIKSKTKINVLPAQSVPTSKARQTRTNSQKCGVFLGRSGHGGSWPHLSPHSQHRLGLLSSHGPMWQIRAGDNGGGKASPHSKWSEAEVRFQERGRPRCQVMTKAGRVTWRMEFAGITWTSHHKLCCSFLKGKYSGKRTRQISWFANRKCISSGGAQGVSILTVIMLSWVLHPKVWGAGISCQKWNTLYH